MRAALTRLYWVNGSLPPSHGVTSTAGFQEAARQTHTTQNVSSMQFNTIRSASALATHSHAGVLL